MFTEEKMMVVKLMNRMNRYEDYVNSKIFITPSNYMDRIILLRDLNSAITMYDELIKDQKETIEMLEACIPDIPDTNLSEKRHIRESIDTIICVKKELDMTMDIIKYIKASL